MKNIVGNIFIAVAVCFMIIGVVHLITLLICLGIPNDKYILQITIRKPSSVATVYGYGYDYIKDDQGNNVVVVMDCYESGWFGYNHSAKQKSFYADLESVKYKNDHYYIPDGFEDLENE
jgi:hypothetical protein